MYCNYIEAFWWQLCDPRAQSFMLNFAGNFVHHVCDEILKQISSVDGEGPSKKPRLDDEVPHSGDLHQLLVKNKSGDEVLFVDKGRTTKLHKSCDNLYHIMAYHASRIHNDLSWNLLNKLHIVTDNFVNLLDISSAYDLQYWMFRREVSYL